MEIDWSLYPNFSKYEFDCKHTGQNLMLPRFLYVLQKIRTAMDQPLVVSSGYRHKTHPVERNKKGIGAHTHGVAADIRINRTDAQDLLVIAYGFGVRRFGIQQKGDMDERFIHLDIADQTHGFAPGIWSY